MTQEIVVVFESQLNPVVEFNGVPSEPVVAEFSETYSPGPAGPAGPAGVSGEPMILAHIASETPHPVYDDGPSLVLKYLNAKV